jgi:ParB-like chromosome segregation protein Spo0J
VSRAAHRSPGPLQLHPAGGFVPDLGRDQYASFLADVAERGVQVPLEITAAGLVLDGRQRLQAALELGLAQVPVRIVAGTLTFIAPTAARTRSRFSSCRSRIA